MSVQMHPAERVATMYTLAAYVYYNNLIVRRWADIKYDKILEYGLVNCT